MNSGLHSFYWKRLSFCSANGVNKKYKDKDNDNDNDKDKEKKKTKRRTKHFLYDFVSYN